MYYYRIEANFVKKYNVELEHEKLKELREEIIENCSLIEHCERKTIGLLNYNESCIRNLKQTKIGVIKPSMPHLPSENAYLVEYDEYHYPELVYLIDKLLFGDMSVIEQIQNPNFDELEKKQKSIVLKEVEKIMNNSDGLDSKIQSELLTLNQQKALKISSSREYYSKVYDCIVFNELAKLDIKYLEDTISFFDDNVADESIKKDTVCKVLSKENTKKINN